MDWFSILRMLGGDASAAASPDTAGAAGSNIEGPPAPETGASAPAPNAPAPVPEGKSAAPQAQATTQNVTNKRGLLDQVLRGLAVYGGFAQGGVRGGMGMLDYFNEQDAMRGDAISKATAQGLTVEQAEQMAPQIDWSAHKQDSPQGTDFEGNPLPSGVVGGYATPQHLEAARKQYFAAKRSLPSYQENPEEALLAQRTGMPRDTKESQMLRSMSMPEGGYPSGQFNVGESISPEGEVSTQVRRKGFLDRSYSLQEFNNLPVPQGTEKIPFPDEDVPPGEAPRVFVKYMDKNTGRSMSVADYANYYAQHPELEAEGKKMFGFLKPGRGASTKEAFPGQHALEEQEGFRFDAEDLAVIKNTFSPAGRAQRTEEALLTKDPDKPYTPPPSLEEEYAQVLSRIREKHKQPLAASRERGESTLPQGLPQQQNVPTGNLSAQELGQEDYATVQTHIMEGFSSGGPRMAGKILGLYAKQMTPDEQGMFIEMIIKDFGLDNKTSNAVRNEARKQLGLSDVEVLMPEPSKTEFGTALKQAR